MTLQISGGISMGSGITIKIKPAPVIPGSITYNEMGPPVVAKRQIQDATATVNSSTGFTINNHSATGIAVPALTALNKSFFTAKGRGYFTATFGTGSTYASATVQIISAGSPFIFYIDSTLNYPATFNYPITIT